MITFLPKVKLTKLSPQMSMVPCILQNFIGEVIVTVGEEGVHKTNSKHYSGNALDFRTKHLSSYASPPARVDMLQAIARKLKTSLGPDYDVVLENINELNEHLHVEYDPKS